jgi:hypothetical protein
MRPISGTLWALRAEFAAVGEPALGGCSDYFALLKALPAKYWTALRRFERNGCFPLAPGANGLGFNPLIIAAILWQSQGLGPFAFAVFAAFGFVLELLIVKEELFPSGEDEIGAAVHTLENLVLELHLRVPPFLHSPQGTGTGVHTFPMESQK